MRELLSLLLSRAHNWAEAAPWLAALMAVGGITVFWVTLSRRRRAEAAANFWPWLRAIIEATAAAVLFLAILWAVRLQLNRVERDFRREHGRVTEVNLQSVRSIWGRPHVQHQLDVEHTVVESVQEELPRSDPEQPPRFITRKVTRQIEQNSIVKTRGAVTIKMNYRRKGSAYYPCFEDDCDFAYTVKNLADVKTTANFRFPLSRGQNLFLDFQVLVDGRDFSDRLNFNDNKVEWSIPMAAGQESTIQVHYTSRGMETWYYQISEAREIRDFKLVIDLPDVPKERLNYPEECLTPTQVTPRGNGTVLTWVLNRAVTTRGMGVELPAPRQPGNLVAGMLQYSWRGGMLLLVGLTVSVLGGSVRRGLVRLALVGGAYCVQFMLLASLSDFRLGLVGALPLGALVAILVSLLALRWPPGAWSPAPAWLVVFFVLVYPLLTLPRTAAPALVTGTDIALLLYLAGVYLVRATAHPQSAT